MIRATDDEIKAIIQQWRDAHPATCKFWKDLARAIRVAIKTGQPILVAPAPQPPIVAAFADGNLTLTLPSGRAITYPEARLIPAQVRGRAVRCRVHGQRARPVEAVSRLVRHLRRERRAGHRTRPARRSDRSASNRAASPLSFIVTTKSPSRFRSDRSPMRTFWRSCSSCPTGRPDCRSAARCIRDRTIWKRPSIRPSRW